MALAFKYIFAVLLISAIMMAPCWFARQTKKNGLDQGIVRVGSWLFGWTGIGWLFALWWAVRK
jgi:hypothetical protein